MKLYLSLLAIIFSLTTHAQFVTNVEWHYGPAPSGSDTIYYDAGKKLVWKDFKGVPDNKSFAIAITSSGFGYFMSMRSTGGRTQLNVSVYCFFSKKNSWVKPGMQSDYALLHEQHHFDITYINACHFVERLRNTVFTLGTYEAQLEALYTEAYGQMNKMQNDYDGQTRNGILKDIQAEWNQKVDAQLKVLPIN